MNSGDLTKLRQSSNVAYYYNNLFLQDPVGILLNRPQRLIESSSRIGLLESRSITLSISEQASTFGTVPLTLYYPPSQPPFSGTPWQILTFTYTGQYQTFSIPTEVPFIQVYMWGAGGGSANPGPDPGVVGGAGAYVNGILYVNPGDTFTVVVGRGGFNNSAAGTDAQGGGGRSINGNTGGGGGRSALQKVVGVDFVTAGGGGGSGNQYSKGGDAAWTGTASNGTNGDGAAGNVGQGASQTAGGAGGNTGGSAGSLGFGGPGGSIGGGGGGGYYGGGGAGFGAGGGGGSSYTSNLINATGANGTTGKAPATTSPYYTSGVAIGAGNGTGLSGNATGGNGLVVVALYQNIPFNLRI